MPPRKRRIPLGKGHRDDVINDAAGEETRLPLPALALICQHIGAKGQNALMGISSEWRDTVLAEARSISLKLPSKASAAGLQPTARLLNRACTFAVPGRLSLGLHMQNNKGSSRVLGDLLKLGSDLSGWASVRELTLKVGQGFNPGMSLYGDSKQVCSTTYPQCSR
jgi:hypothetical protein